MVGTSVTMFDLLISCPGDVIEEVGIIKNTIGLFNRVFGSLNKIFINPKHWSTDSYPQSGDRAQELLNQQFVHDCDAAVVVFWTRFGTPTDKYYSGTEEEIEEMLKMGKQVFMYFSDRPINPSDINHEQHEKVKAFREKYKGKGVYFCFKDINEFEKLFLNHLSLHFLKDITSHDTGRRASYSPKLIMQGLRDGRPIDALYAEQCAISYAKWIDPIQSNIKMLFDEISEMEIPKAMQADDLLNNAENSDHSESKISVLNTLQKMLVSKQERVSIPEQAEKTIVKYLEEKNLECSPEMFYLGNLKREKINYISPLGISGASLEGDENEKKKYGKLIDLWDAVNEYYQIIEYFSELNGLYIIPCIISNVGESFDEDIDIRIHFPHDYVCMIEDLPVPGYGIISSLLENTTLEEMFALPESLHAKEFSNYPDTIMIR